MVSELIKNILTDTEYYKTILKKNVFPFQDDITGNEKIDGPCLLKLLFHCTYANVVVGVEVLRHNLEATRLHPYQNYVDDMLSDMEESYLKIINNKSTCGSIRQYMLNRLLSDPNPKFNAFIEQIKDDIDLGRGLNNHMSHDDIATSARVKYNSIVAPDEYSKLDPKYAKILALTKKVTALEIFVSEILANMTSGGGCGDGYRVDQGKKIVGVENDAMSIKVPPSNTRGRHDDPSKQTW